jgi:hypothetical protein
MKNQTLNQLTLNIPSVYQDCLVHGLKIVIISGILILMLNVAILSNTLGSAGLGKSYAQGTGAPVGTPSTAVPEKWRNRATGFEYDDPSKVVNVGVLCRFNQCVDTDVPNAVPSTGIAMAQQTNNVLTGLTIGKDGAMYVTFKAGTGKWNTIGISPKGVFPPGANIAMAKQTNDILAALAVGNDGAIYVSWVAGGGAWNKQADSTGPGPYPPVPITPKSMFHPGTDIAMAKQTNDRLTAWAIGKNGWLYQSWVDGTGTWNKPVIPPKQGEPVPAYPFKPLNVCCQSHYTDQFGDQRRTGPFIGFDREDGGIAVHKLPDGKLAVLTVDSVGRLNSVNIVKLCNDIECATRAHKDIGPWKLFPFGGDVAMAQQADNLVSSLAIGNNGAMYVSWVGGAGREWESPVQISPPNVFPLGAPIAMAKQTKDVLTALTVGNDGALYVSWTAPGGWNKPLNAKGPGPYSPVGISPKGLFPPGAGIAMTNFNGVLEALIAGKDGSIYVAWTGPKGWDGPVRIY